MNKLDFLGKDRWGNSYYYMDVKNDLFVHFTSLKRAQEIVESKKLLLDSPYAGMGAYGNFAISLTYGEFVPGVQTTHIKADPDEGEVVAVRFKTNTVPKKLGSVDEVSFGEQNVNLINPEIVSKEKAISLIKSSPIKLSEGDADDRVVYDKSLIPKLNIATKKASYNALINYFRNTFE